MLSLQLYLCCCCCYHQGWKLVYSGDTRPCQRLCHFGAGATLLIHEATFEPDLLSQALRKRHTTTAEAVQCGKAMSAYRTILTHFSQRYPKLPAGIDAHALPRRERPMVAFDGMVVTFEQLPHLPALMPVVATALADDEDAEGAANGIAS